MTQTAAYAQPDYRLRPPWFVRVAVLAGLAAAPVGAYLIRANRPLLGGLLLAASALAGVQGTLLLLILNRRKRERVRRRMVEAIRWRGDEQVLDVGCGNGIVMLAAAKRLKPGQGKATGIDVWEPLAGQQTADRLCANAALEGVADRVELRQADARRMPFASASFDVIFASLSLHHMGGSGARRRALGEMMRVLRPGGAIVIHDIFPIANHAARVLRELGASGVERLGGSLLRTLRIEKPT